MELNWSNTDCHLDSLHGGMIEALLRQSPPHFKGDILGLVGENVAQNAYFSAVFEWILQWVQTDVLCFKNISNKEMK